MISFKFLLLQILEHHPLHPEHKLTPEISLKDPADLFLLYSGLKKDDEVRHERWRPKDYDN